MGQIKNPMQIHWNGGVGGVIGLHRWGKHYYRAFAQSVHNPNTPSQQEVRARFSFVTKLVAKFMDAYVMGWKYYAQGMAPRAAFFKSLIDDGAVTGNMNSGYTVDYEKVYLSKGSVLPTFNMTCSVIGAQHKVSLSWTSNAGQGTAKAGDKLNVVLYDVTKGVIMPSYGQATRQTEALQVQYPTAWAGDTVYTFVFWTSVDDNDNSDSQMLNFFVAE